VIIPTYNEKNNIQNIITQVLNSDTRVEILVVDDNSPDGTADIVSDIARENGKVHLLKRAGKLGLGSAYIDGFKRSVELGFDVAFQMDADFSHDPKYIPSFLEELKNCDVVVGSRYIKGISVINWSLSRLLLSYFANIYAKIVTGVPVNDLTGGFKCIKKEVLESVDFTKFSSNGYAFQIELNYSFYSNGFKIKELPIVFVDREEGESKMSNSIVLEAIYKIWTYRFKNYRINS
jgi:dolichol-phosphate mannosyltransferase